MEPPEAIFQGNVIPNYPGHIQIIWFADETHLTRQKSDPTDPDYPGHPTHLQRCTQAYLTFSHFLELIEPYTQRDSYKGVTAIL